MKKNLILSSLLIFSSGAKAQDLCHLVKDRDVTHNVMPRTPNYFFKTSSDGRYIYYISDDRNWLYDTVNKTEEALPGSADPVPSADGKILTSLFRDPKTNYWKIQINEMKDGRPVGEGQVLENLLGGSYQSVGVVDPSGSVPILYFDEMTNEVKVEKLSKDKKGNYSMKVFSTMFAGKDYRLPMMSPDGKRFSVLNVTTNKTEIFELDTKSNSYKQKKVLPFAGGKASFSPDGERVTFHLSRDIAPVKMIFDNIYPHILANDAQVRDIYVYDIRNDSLQQVTNNYSGNSYFPIFLGEGKVAYVDKKVDGDHFEIQYSTIPQGQQRSFDVLANCYGEDPTDRLMELSYLWNEACKKSFYEDQNGHQVATMLNLSDENCKKLANQSGDDELMRFCGAMKEALGKTKKVNVQTPTEKHPGEKVIALKCQMCHSDKSMDWYSQNASEVEARINSNKTKYRMPMGGSPLSPQEKKDLMDYVLHFKK